MSKKGDCYDNAAMEHSFKVEMIHGERFITWAQAKALNCSETWYLLRTP